MWSQGRSPSYATFLESTNYRFAGQWLHVTLGDDSQRHEEGKVSDRQRKTSSPSYYSFSEYLADVSVGGRISLTLGMLSPFRQLLPSFATQ